VMRGLCRLLRSRCPIGHPSQYPFFARQHRPSRCLSRRPRPARRRPTRECHRVHQSVQSCSDFRNVEHGKQERSDESMQFCSRHSLVSLDTEVLERECT